MKKLPKATQLKIVLILRQCSTLENGFFFSLPSSRRWTMIERSAHTPSERGEEILRNFVTTQQVKVAEFSKKRWKIVKFHEHSRRIDPSSGSKRRGRKNIKSKSREYDEHEMFVQRKMKIVWITSLRQQRRGGKARKGIFLCLFSSAEKKKKIFFLSWKIFSFLFFPHQLVHTERERGGRRGNFRRLNWGNLMKIQGLQFPPPWERERESWFLTILQNWKLFTFTWFFVLLSNFFSSFLFLRLRRLQYTSRAEEKIFDCNFKLIEWLFSGILERETQSSHLVAGIFNN